MHLTRVRFSYGEIFQKIDTTHGLSETIRVKYNHSILNKKYMRIMRLK